MQTGQPRLFPWRKHQVQVATVERYSANNGYSVPASNAARSVSASGTGRPVPASNNLSVPGHLLIFAIVTCTLCLIAAFKPILERNRIEAEGRHVVYASLFAEKGLSEAVEDIITSPGRPASGRQSKFCRGDDSGCLFYRENISTRIISIPC